MKITFEFPELTNPEEYLTKQIKKKIIPDSVLYAYYLVKNNPNPEFNPEEYLDYMLEDEELDFTNAKKYLPIIKAIHQLSLPNTRKLLIKLVPNVKAYYIDPDEF